VYFGTGVPIFRKITKRKRVESGVKFKLGGRKAEEHGAFDEHAEQLPSAKGPFGFSLLFSICCIWYNTVIRFRKLRLNGTQEKTSAGLLFRKMGEYYGEDQGVYRAYNPLGP